MAERRTGTSGYLVKNVGEKKNWTKQGVVKNQPSKDADTTFGPPTNSPSGQVIKGDSSLTWLTNRSTGSHPKHTAAGDDRHDGSAR